jgi:hypothetical protein
MRKRSQSRLVTPPGEPVGPIHPVSMGSSRLNGRASGKLARPPMYATQQRQDKPLVLVVRLPMTLKKRVWLPQSTLARHHVVAKLLG